MTQIVDTMCNQTNHSSLSPPPDQNPPMLCGAFISYYHTSPSAGNTRKNTSELNKVHQNPSKIFIKKRTRTLYLHNFQDW